MRSPGGYHNDRGRESRTVDVEHCIALQTGACGHVWCMLDCGSDHVRELCDSLAFSKVCHFRAADRYQVGKTC